MNRRQAIEARNYWSDSRTINSMVNVAHYLKGDSSVNWSFVEELLEDEAHDCPELNPFHSKLDEIKPLDKHCDASASSKTKPL